IPFPLSLENYAALAADTKWSRPFLASLVLAVLAASVCMVVATAVGRAIPKLRRPGAVVLIAALPLFVPGMSMGAALFIFLRSFNAVLRSIFLRGTETTMPIWNWVMAASQQSQVPIIFALASIVLVVTLPLLAAFFWLMFVKLDRS